MNIPCQLNPGDVATLKLVQSVMPRDYVYLEIGSYLGGSLYTHLLDSKCQAAWSVDLRSTAKILDERNIDYAYTTTTKDMLNVFKQNNVPTNKLHTVDGTIQHVPTVPVDLVFIDGEHTNTAAYADAVEALRFQPSIIMFHDDWIVWQGIDKFLQYLRSNNIPSAVYKMLHSDITVVVLQDEPFDFSAQSRTWLNFVPEAQQRLNKGN